MDLAKKRVRCSFIFNSVKFLIEMHIITLNFIMYSNFHQKPICSLRWYNSGGKTRCTEPLLDAWNLLYKCNIQQR